MNKRVLLKYILLAGISVPALPAKAQLTPGPVSGEGCRIHYDYDLGGNRIKREYLCPSGGDVLDPVSPVILTSVYPNPTSGRFTAVFTEPTAQAGFMITAIDGSVVQAYELAQLSSSVSFDISAQVPGTYFLTVWAFDKEETWTITKIQ